MPPGGKWRVAAIGSSFLQRRADHRLGDVKPTPRKDTVIFWANRGKIQKEGIYRVIDEDKYHRHLPGWTLSRPCALRGNARRTCITTT